MAWLNRDNYQLYYEVIGEGKPLVFLHGIGGNLEQVKNIYHKADDVQLIVMNLQGHANSSADVSDLSFARQAEDVIALADELQLDKFDIAGISMGAAIALKLAIGYPERIDRMILVRNAWINEPMNAPILRLYDLVYEYIRKPDLAGFQATEEYQLIEKECRHTAEVLSSLFSDPASLAYPEKFDQIPHDRPYEDDEQLRKLRLPTLILANQQDPVHLFGYGEKIHELIKDSILVEITSKDIDSARHVRQLNEAISAFLKGEL